MQKLPRVKLNMVATSVMSVSMWTLGSALYLKDSNPSYSQALDWVQVFSVVLLMFSFGAGIEKSSYPKYRRVVKDWS